MATATLEHGSRAWSAVRAPCSRGMSTWSGSLPVSHACIVGAACRVICACDDQRLLCLHYRPMQRMPGHTCRSQYKRDGPFTPRPEFAKLRLCLLVRSRAQGRSAFFYIYGYDRFHRGGARPQHSQCDGPLARVLPPSQCDQRSQCSLCADHIRTPRAEARPGH